MDNAINVKIKTLSNLLIGGAPTPFEIGGVDMTTATDAAGYPYIPGSSLKGALRAIARYDHSSVAKDIAQMFSTYLENEEEKNKQRIKALVDEEAVKERIRNRYEAAKAQPTAEYLFGIEGFNVSPKLLFSNLYLCDKPQDPKVCFSIDMKNSISEDGERPVSNPRTYKTARAGLVFEGQIQFSRIEKLGEGAIRLCRSFVVSNLEQFNEGIHRLGNSKSRGYGKVEISFLDESGAIKSDGL